MEMDVVSIHIWIGAHEMDVQVLVGRTASVSRFLLTVQMAWMLQLHVVHAEGAPQHEGLHQNARWLLQKQQPQPQLRMNRLQPLMQCDFRRQHLQVQPSRVIICFVMAWQMRMIVQIWLVFAHCQSPMFKGCMFGQSVRSRAIRANERAMGPLIRMVAKLSSKSGVT
jgi:hypothetical protein